MFTRASNILKGLLLAALTGCAANSSAAQSVIETCRDIAYVTTIRTSEYYLDGLSSRGGIISYRVFRENLLAPSDLVAAVVVDSPLSAQTRMFLLADLRAYEIRFVLFPSITAEGEMDLNPNFHYAMRAFRSMRGGPACHMMYVSPHSLFLKDPTDLILSTRASHTGPAHDLMCLRHAGRVESTAVEQFLTSSGSSADVIAVGKESAGRTHYPIFCNPDLIFFANVSLLQGLMDITDGLTSSYYFYNQYQRESPSSELAAADRHQYESILLHTALITAHKTSHLKNHIGELPSYVGTDLSALDTALVNSGPEQLFILLSPQISKDGQRVKFGFERGVAGQPCVLDVSQWNHLSSSLGTNKYSLVANTAIKQFEAVQYSCDVLANSFAAIPFADYLEFGTRALSNAALPWHFGHTVINNASETVSYTAGLLQLTDQFGPRAASLVHFSPPLSGDIQQCSVDRSVPSGVHEWFDELLVYYERIPHVEMHLVQRRLPCAIWLDAQQPLRRGGCTGGIEESSGVSFCTELLSRYRSRLYRLGFIPAIDLCKKFQNEFLVMGPHCPNRDFGRIRLLTPAHVSAELTSFYANTTDLSKREEIGSDEESAGAAAGSRQGSGGGDGDDNGGVPAGLLVADRPGQEFKVIDDPIPPDLVDMLIGRLLHKSIVQKNPGANSYFIKFDGSKPRSLVEAFIIDHLVPLVLGSQEEARENGFIGAEWWTQQRAEDDPKEYHMDTAITWCRDNGWPDELISSCFFYPAVGSVVYLTDEGGPTAVFNQTPGRLGMTPLLPTEVALVFPRRNRLMLFNGAKFHGVMRRKPCVSGSDTTSACLPRVTLLVNYWRDKTAGESYTTTIPQENAYMKHYASLNKAITHEEAENNKFGQDMQKRWSSPREIAFPREFSSDFLQWKQNVVPSEIMNQIAAIYRGFKFNDGTHLYEHDVSDPTCPEEESCISTEASPYVLLKMNPSELVQSYAESLGRQFHHWPKWEVIDGRLVMYNINVSTEDLLAWKRSMPGYVAGGPW